MAVETDLMDRVVALCKRRGFVFPSSEIYGGLAGCFDYGPQGVALKRLVKDDWWRAMVSDREDVVGLDSGILMAARVWEVSGHVAGFHDPLVDCKKCKARFRADMLQELSCPERPSKHPGECGGELTEPRQFNMMFKTQAGAVEDESATVYLRPETAQGIFVNFKNVLETTRVKVPFGIAQVGKAFRNEIVTRNFLFRMREFEQMECEFFCAPGTEEEWFERWKADRMAWWKGLGVRPSHLRLRPHEKEELAHYAKACVDVEYRFSFGWKEVEGIASRTDFDLKAHQEGTRRPLAYLDEATKAWTVPYVIEPSAGVDRCFLTVLADAYEEETKPNGESRVVLHLHPKLAPVQVGVYPLVRKDGMPERARRIFEGLRGRLRCLYDESATVGKRYAQQDEVGTPFGVTVDSQTLTDGTVTVRDRDTMAQDRVAEGALADHLAERVRAWKRTDPEEGAGVRLAVLAAACLLAVGAACGSTTPQAFRTTDLEEAPGEFHAMRSTLVGLARLREAKDAASARAQREGVVAQAVTLLKMGPPSDLPREVIPHFLEGRAAFSDAVNAFDRAARSSDDAALWRASVDLEGAFWAWYDAYRNRPTEGAV